MWTRFISKSSFIKPSSIYTPIPLFFRRSFVTIPTINDTEINDTEINDCKEAVINNINNHPKDDYQYSTKILDGYYGQYEVTEVYKNDVLHGKKSHNDMDGNLLRTEEYDEGDLVKFTTYTSDRIPDFTWIKNTSDTVKFSTDCIFYHNNGTPKYKIKDSTIVSVCNKDGICMDYDNLPLYSKLYHAVIFSTTVLKRR
jgi:hypothetical protein